MTSIAMQTKPDPKKIIRFKGVDVFYPSPNTQDRMTCLACGSDMTVQRGAYGPTGWAESMGRGAHKHDVFTCPNSGHDWHTQIIKIKEEIQKTASGVLADMMQKEIDLILLSKEATKKVTTSW